MRKFIALSIIIAAFAGSFLLRQRLDAPESESDRSAPALPVCARIICLSPGLTETVFALGLGEQVVGVTRYCLYPPEAQQRPNIGGFLDPNYEALVALHPDIVFVTPYQQDLTEDLRRLGLTVHNINQDSLANIRDSYRYIAALCGCAAQADALIQALDARLAQIERELEERPRPRVLMTTGRDVRSGSLDEIYAVGRGTFLDELLTLLGGENVAPGVALEYPSLSAEGILRLDPDIIIELVADREFDPALEEQALAAWQALPNLRAYREENLYVLFGTYLTVPGPRVIHTLDALARCLHPNMDGTS